MTSVVDQLDDFLIDQVVMKKSVSGEMSFAPSNNPAHLALLKKKKFKQSFIDGIMQVNNCRFKWVDPTHEDMHGQAEIRPVDVIAKRTFLAEEQDEDDTPLHCFHVVDRLWNMDVGIFSGKHAGDSLYYLEDATCYYLGLNMEGYVKMLIATRGFKTWQWALISHRDSTHRRSRDVLEFEQHLPRLFPEVSIKEVYALYDSLYISEEMAPGTE